MHGCDPSTQEVGVVESEVQDHPWLLVSLGQKKKKDYGGGGGFKIKISPAEQRGANIILAPGGWEKQDDQKSKASLVYRVSSYLKTKTKPEVQY